MTVMLVWHSAPHGRHLLLRHCCSSLLQFPKTVCKERKRVPGKRVRSFVLPSKATFQSDPSPSLSLLLLSFVPSLCPSPSRDSPPPADLYWHLEVRRCCCSAALLRLNHNLTLTFMLCHPHLSQEFDFPLHQPRYGTWFLQVPSGCWGAYGIVGLNFVLHRLAGHSQIQRNAEIQTHKHNNYLGNICESPEET